MSKKLRLSVLFTIIFSVLATSSQASQDWNIGIYAGKFYDSTPLKALAGFRDTSFEDHYMLSLSVGKKIWQSQHLPLSIEIETMIGQQFGEANITELAVAPLLRWDGLPWNYDAPVVFRVAPIGVSWLSKVSPLEPNKSGGEQWLNYFVLDAGYQLPNHKGSEVFFRLHHRCTYFELLGDDVKNGEDFVGIGYRRYFN